MNLDYNLKKKNLLKLIKSNLNRFNKIKSISIF